MAQLTFEQAAKICYQANKALCEINGDFSQVDWENASDDNKKSAISTVMSVADMVVSGRVATAKDLFEIWKKFKIANGYVYGPVKDDAKKTHPCIVDYENLPEFQRKKDELLLSIIEAFF